jgi:DNA modification methylase
MDKIPDQSVDAVITDPPYPCIKRDYGYWTVDEWWTLIVDGVIPQVRRILKPTGSAVFILQPNSEHVGQMRGWLWEFMAWVCREWNMVQDVWWWNYTALPTVHTHRDKGLARPSLKACVWCGGIDCYRDQDGVLWSETEHNIAQRANCRWELRYSPSGAGANNARMGQAALDRGGVTPFNVIPLPQANSTSSAGANGHGAGTPQKLADWWTRYIVPPGGVVCDPFIGSGTMGLAALENNCSIIGIERDEGHFKTAQRRLERAMSLPYQIAFPS